MFKVTKRIEISASHSLDLPYVSKCKNPHGHNWIIEVEVSSKKLNAAGMVIDFVHIKKVVMNYDHANINDLMSVNPTAECMAELIACQIDHAIEKENPFAKVTKITVQESEGNIACYIP